MDIKNNLSKMIVLKYMKNIKKAGRDVKAINSLKLMPGMNKIDMSKSEFDNAFKNDKIVEYYLDAGELSIVGSSFKKKDD